MVFINSTSFGSITIDNKNYTQVLIINNQIEERDEKQLYKLFGTTHQIGDWEVEKLLSSQAASDNNLIYISDEDAAQRAVIVPIKSGRTSPKPEIIIIGSGQSGVLKVNNEIKQKILGLGIKLTILVTPEAIKEFNKINQTNQKVNALIHTTC